jgi:membrane-bound lytic murein transglycosylase F
VYRLSTCLLILLAALCLASCSDEASAPAAADTEAPPAHGPAAQAGSPDSERAAAEPARFVGDLDELRRRGVLRILVPANAGSMVYLPRAGWPVAVQHQAAEAFARANGLRPRLVPVERFGDLIPALRKGHGDVIAANLTVTAQRRERIAFSVPLTTVRQQVLVASTEAGIDGPGDLVGRRVMVMPGSSFWDAMQRLQQEHPGIEIVPRPEGLSDEAALDRVAAGDVDATVRDSNIVDMYLGYRDDIAVAFSLPGTDDIAWGLRRDAPDLRAALNRFLHLEWIADADLLADDGGWEGIRQRRSLRVLLRNNAASYFLHRGELLGFEYEMALAFAEAHKLRLEVVVPRRGESLVDALLAGRADLAAGFLEPDDAARGRGVAFSRPYHFAARHLVVNRDDELASLDELAGRTVTVRRSSPYWQELVDLQHSGVRLHIDIAPEDVETEELIAQVARGALGATVADGHLLDIELARGLAVRSGLVLSEERPHAVAVRAGDDQLLAELDDFIKQQYRGLVYNMLRRKYFSNPSHVRADKADATAVDGALSPYDGLVRRYAERYGFDWRLVMAQIYQESRFDPDARSFAGAVGLMQVMPRTARFMGFERVDDVELSIHAGLKYLDWVRNRFEPELNFNDRLWFTLAAYNAGHGHVADARRLARRKGWDPDRWFGNVERAMLLLARDEYASQARHGYVRGQEPVSYVRDIRERYRAYVGMLERLPARQDRLADNG